MYRQKNYWSKYRAVKQTYNGVNYDSKLEASRAYELDMLKKGGQIKDWDRQFKVELYYYDSEGRKYPTKSWKIDFRVHNPDGSFTLEEVKGLELPDFKFKRELLENVWLKDHPEYDFVVLKQNSIKKHF